jgi:hypothetical protein
MRSMSQRRASVLAWGLCALTLAAAALAAALSLADAGADWAKILPPDARPSSDAGVGLSLLDTAWLVAFAVVGALVASNRPRSPIGWMLGAIPAALTSITLCEAVYFHAADTSGGEPGRAAELCLWLANWAWVPAVILVLVFLPLLFPTGRPPSPRWRIVAGAAAASGVLMVVGTAFDAGPLENYSWVENPLGAGWMPSWVSWLGFALWWLTAPAAAASVVVRFRRSHGVEREQLKWFTAAAAQLVAAFVISFGLSSVIGERAGWAIIAAALLGVAVAVAMAILRHRLYDIDVVINRALVYGALTATLGATYLALVVLIGLAVGRSGFAVAASTLAVAALFGPARARIQGVVDRRFYRRKYDAQLTLEAFAARLRDEVALDALDSELRGVVSSTMQPAHVSLWLRAPAQLPKSVV